MPSLFLPQRFRRLNKTLLRSPDQQTNIPHELGHSGCLANAQDDRSLRWIEQLDDVHPRVAFADLLLNTTQALSTLHPTSRAFGDYLRKLMAVCGRLEVVPQSHMLLPTLLETTGWPIAARGSCDAYEGTYNGSKVCVKRLRIYSGERQKNVKNVGDRYNAFFPAFL